MNCRIFNEMLADYLGEELAADDRQRMEVHARGCADCRAELEGLATVQAVLHDLPGVTQEEAARQSAVIQIRRRPGGVAAKFIAFGRYAAVLLVGVGLGWFIAGPEEAGQGSMVRDEHTGVVAGGIPTPNSHAPPVTEGMAASAGEPVHPDWFGYAREASARHEQWPTFARQLALLSSSRIATRGR